MEKPAPPPRSATRSGKSTPTKVKTEDEISEEEAQRLKIEAEKKELEELAKKKMEEERIAALNEVRQIQEQETESELENVKKIIEDFQESNKTDYEWHRYMRCDGKPDPTSLTQINTFIALTKEKRNADINVVLDEAEVILSLLSELRNIMNDPLQTKTPEQASIYRGTILALQDLLMVRYNDATLKLLEEASYEADSETGNLQKVIKGSNETLMIWGNLNKNPRFKSYKFDSEKFQFELPKFLAMTDVAVRVLKTSFDHYSHQCSTFFPKAEKAKNATSDEVYVEEDNEGEGINENVIEDKEKEEEVNSTAIANGRKSELSVNSNKEEKQDNEEVEDEKLPDDTGDPGEILPDAETAEKNEVEIELEEILDPDVVDLRQFHPLGGIYHIDLLELPPQPKNVKGWTLTQIYDKPLTFSKYPSDQSTKINSRSPSAVPETREEGVTPTKTPVEQQQPPIALTLQLPSDVMFFEEPQVAVWDKTDLHWKTKGISEPHYDEEKRTFSFKTSEFGVFSFSQDGHLNMPFQSWELRPKTPQSSALTITGAIAEAEIEIKGMTCRLNPPAEDPPSALSNIYNKWMSVNELVEAMKAAGVDLFPAVDSHKFVDIKTKEVDLDHVYEQMALLSSGFAFSWSKWNNRVPQHQIVFQAAPFLPSGSTDESQSVPDDDWCTYILSNDRCYMLAISEFDDDFSDEIASGCSYHCDLLHAIRQSSKRPNQNLEIAAQKSKSYNAFRVNTVDTLLKATKFVSFS